MVVTAVPQQSSMRIIRQSNQVQVMGARDAEKEVVQEEAVIKDVTDEADVSTTEHKQNIS